VTTPQLLVSVRSPGEALNAVRGGAHIVDIKDPSAGPLGMASFSVIRSIAETLETLPRSPPLSLALGELRDWFEPRAAAALTAVGSLQFLRGLLDELSGVRFLKCGLSGFRNDARWVHLWEQLRRAAPPAIGWVAVAYADAERAAAPEISDVLNAAINAGARAVLIDTFVKDGRRLLDWLSPQQLGDFSQQCHKHHILLALAGQVSSADFAVLRGAGADIVAVRGAACAGADRLQAVSEQRVNLLVNALDRAVQSCTPQPMPDDTDRKHLV
jgi:hypothetical protein